MSRDQTPKATHRWGLGPAGVGYLFVTALLLFLSFYTQSSLLFWSFGLMVGGLISSVVVAGAMTSGLEVHRVLPGHGVAGEAAVLRYRITNRKSWMPVFSLVIQETWGPGRRGWKRHGPMAESPPRLGGRPHGWVLHLGPNQVVQAEAPCWPLRRGALRFEKVILSTAFPFGTVRRDVIFELPGELLVFPHLYRIDRRLIYRLSEMDPLGHRHIDKGGGTEEFYGLRQYRPGDSLKMIDWKRTARTGQLVSREMTLPSPPRVMIALDLSEPVTEDPGQHQAVERAVSLTASLVCDAYFNGHQVGLMVRGARAATFPVHHSLPHRTRLLETLAMLDAMSRRTDPPVSPTAPTVVVRPGGADEESREGGRLVLSAERMHEYVTDPDRGADALLARRAAPASRRRELEGGPA